MFLRCEPQSWGGGNFLAVRDCLLNIFAVILHNWRPPYPSTTRERAMSLWQGPA